MESARQSRGSRSKRWVDRFIEFEHKAFWILFLISPKISPILYSISFGSGGRYADYTGVARADLKWVPRKPFHLAAIAGKVESNAALALLGHGVVQIEKLAIAD